ncbi:hypothetical protein GLOIN_2v1774361 [Rhizophagus irregularis DAOM 181602=DAOM 197198]|uniref:Protein kinase domain-containing protein n=1 Tax=Rhizophagus irregularis (strain DAOM 181602 / DAOM 197198 / MUCL 43194) TaxID=747089 RepID=A0A2P4Q2H6_RHIID|nr:hypothetical protein GLOIN_2v1774361 [Rhizophagus irregularis DAOM 181602=DAOM 197198]POG71816.1 hypothetical protein GLOIN_2v1774361 [Rhizophagus irregularis DAOM 181602=DAOM 197198]|eukprot:XP_025178682.1 hypothetical protein GLOIN_2v1774361 [Rhizophagus irregularis DAOM 181602=DAOM 197198]
MLNLNSIKRANTISRMLAQPLSRKSLRMIIESSGLKVIHESNLTHGDFHDGNILISDDYKESFIIDLGLCKPISDLQDPNNEIYGVLPYMAPEILRGNPYIQVYDNIFHQDYIDNEVTSKAEEEKPKVESPIDTIVIVNENEIEPLTNPQANVEQENVNNAKVENRKNLDGDETEPLLPKSNSKQVIFIIRSFPGEYKDRTMEFLKDFFEADRWWKKLLKKNKKAKKELVKQDEQVKQDRQVKQDGNVEQVV